MSSSQSFNETDRVKFVTMLQDFTWDDTLDEMRRHFRNGFSFPPHPTAQIKPIHVNDVAAELISIPSAPSEQVILVSSSLHLC
ncbi:MAG: hypothetical protein AAFV90_29940 [Cyanobacteria bacterium J06634_5]